MRLPSTNLDGDKLIDMILGENTGKLYLYEQQTSNSHEFGLVSDSLNVESKFIYRHPMLRTMMLTDFLSYLSEAAMNLSQQVNILWNGMVKIKRDNLCLQACIFTVSLPVNLKKRTK